jgi:hypothetical protein
MSAVTAATLAFTAFAGSAAQAQQVKRIELKATVTESQFGEIEVGKTVRVTAIPGDVERFGIPVLIKVKVAPPAVTLEPVVLDRFFVNGNVTKSKIGGIRDGDRLECTIDLTSLTCERQRGSAASLTFRAAIKDLLVAME